MDKLLAGFITVFVCAMIFIAIDSFGISQTERISTIVEKKVYEPPYTTTSTTKIGDIDVPVTTHHPETHNLQFRIDKKKHSLVVSSSLYYRVEVGDQIRVTYTIGRITKKAYPKSASIAE